VTVGYRSSSTTGSSDAFVTSLNIPVPSGAASGDVAVLSIEQWESTNPTVTWPSGFTEFVNTASGSEKIKAAWKRLTGADSGNYSPSWTGSQWSQGQCVLITGALSTGNPIDASNVATSGSGTTVPTATVTATAADFLLHVVANENTAATTPPTSFTEVQDANYLHNNYRIPGASGSYSATGATLSASTLSLAALIAVLPDAGATAITPKTVRLPQAVFRAATM